MSPRHALAVLLLLAAATTRAESFKSWAARGAREEREKDSKAAFSSYSNALTQWQDDDGAAPKAKVLCARAALREKDGDDAGAMEDLSGCLAIDKKNAKAFHHRGQLYLKQGKTSTAIGDFYKAVALDIGFGQAYFDRATAYEQQGEKEFAGEDYRHACELGVKAACPKAKTLRGKRAGKSAKKKSKSEAKTSPASAEEAAPNEGAAEDGATVPDAAAPEPAAPTKAATAPKTSYYAPKYRDCLSALNACVDGGDSFGTCVHKAPDCDKKAVKGCCPAACFKAYQKSLNHDRSEAEAFRDNFAPDAACGVPPKADDDD